MTLKRLFKDDDAVSPVIGVILMVAITVILAAVIGTFVLDLADNVSQTASAGVDADNAANTATLNSLGNGAEGIKCSGADLDTDDNNGANTTVIGNTIDCSTHGGNSVVAYSTDDNVENATVYTFDN